MDSVAAGQPGMGAEHIARQEMGRRRFMRLLLSFSLVSTVAMIVTPIVGFLIPKKTTGGAGGPTVTAHTDDIRTIDESEDEVIEEIAPGGKTKMLLARGRLKDFRACLATTRRVGRKGLCIDPEAAELLGVKEGDKVLAVRR